MKKLVNVKASIEGGKLTVTADIAEAQPHEFQFPAQQQSVGYLHPNHLRHPRHVQISGEAVFVKAQAGSFSFLLDDFVAISGLVEPKTLPPPSFKTLPSPTNLTAELSPDLEAGIQWKWANSANHQDKWTNIEGATTLTLTLTPELKGKWVSCVAENESGAIATPPVLI